MKKTITDAEWLAELGRIARKSDEGLTSREWAEKLGFSVGRTMRLLKMAKVKGRLVVGKGAGEGLDGRQTHPAVYRITDGKP